jgi:hypothetical protein
MGGLSRARSLYGRELSETIRAVRSARSLVLGKSHYGGLCETTYQNHRQDFPLDSFAISFPVHIHLKYCNVHKAGKVSEKFMAAKRVRKDLTWKAGVEASCGSLLREQTA